MLVRACVRACVIHQIRDLCLPALRPERSDPRPPPAHRTRATRNSEVGFQLRLNGFSLPDVLASPHLAFAPCSLSPVSTRAAPDTRSTRCRTPADICWGPSPSAAAAAVTAMTAAPLPSPTGNELSTPPPLSASPIPRHLSQHSANVGGPGCTCTRTRG